MNNETRMRAVEILRNEFGDNWQSIVQSLGTENLRQRVGKDLTSFIAYPDRGDGGSNAWRGNCSPKVVEAITKYVMDAKRYYGKDISDFTLLDPMSGSGTSKFAADKLGIRSVLYDLNPEAPHGRGGWNALRDEVDDSADIVFFHPPYHTMIAYSGNMWGSPHPDDLSRCSSYKEFIEKLNFVLKKLYMSLRKDGRLAVLVGDMRLKGNFYSMQSDMMKLGEYESFIVKGQFNCVSDNRTYAKPFVPIVTEYLLLFHKQDALMIPFARTMRGRFDISQKDDASLTWHHLIRMTMESVGGTAELSTLYVKLETHPKAKNNEHYKERIRATIYEHKDQYVSCGNGCYRLAYQVA